jgi:hypothetical protein
MATELSISDPLATGRIRKNTHTQRKRIREEKKMINDLMVL